MKKKIVIACVSCLAVAAAVVGVFLLVPVFRGPYAGTVTQKGSNMPLAGVSVTDGRNVVKTDADGRFELKGWRKSRFITLTVPSGFAAETFYLRIEKETKRYDFMLEKTDADSTQHTFLHISDTEIGEDGTGEWLDSLRGVVQEIKPALLIHTGDICYEAGLKRHIQDMNSTNMGTAVHYTMGNHDYVSGKYGEELYESLYGPIWYSFEVGNIHYVVTPFQGGSDKPSGYHKNDRWRWLENDLANTDPGKKVVMFNHTTSPAEDYVISFDRKDLDLKQHNLAAWLYGHYHVNHINEAHGVINISTARPDCGGIDQSASGPREVFMDANGIAKTKMHYYEFPAKEGADAAKWTAQLDGNVLFCDTLVAGDYVYTATVNDDYPASGGVHCLRADTGASVWSYQTKNSVKNNLAYQDGMLYAQDSDGVIYCLDAESGALLWERALDVANGTGSLNTSSGICIIDDTLYAGSAQSVYALALPGGEVKWHSATGRGESSPSEFVVAGDVLLAGSHWDALYALDIESGKKRWDNADADLRFRSSTPVPLDDKRILVADSSAIMIIELASGTITSKKSFEDYNFSSSAQPLVLDRIAYIPTANQGLIAYDIKDEAVLWNVETDPALVFTAPYVGKGAQTVEGSPVLVQDNIVFTASDGNVYTIDKDSGKVLNKQFAGAAIFGKAGLHQGSIIVADFSGKVSCFGG